MVSYGPKYLDQSKGSGTLVSRPLDRHLSLSIHGKFCLPISGISFQGAGGIRLLRGFLGIMASCFICSIISEDRLDIEIGIRSYDFDGQGEILVQIL